MTSYNSKESNILNAKAFIESLSAEDGRNSKKSNILYAVLGKTDEWTNEPTPDTPEETDFDKHRVIWSDSWGAKKINTGDVAHVIPRYNWVSGTVYAMYRNTDTNLYNRSFYVITDENNVYKCLYNNKGAISTVKPSGFSTIEFTSSDGYTWKYMYTVSLGRQNKFMTSNHIPVQTLDASDGSDESSRQIDVQNAAANGTLNIIEVNDTGSGYTFVSNAVVEQATSLTCRISATTGGQATGVDNFYNGSSLYISAGTGSGQLRRIIKYEGSTKTFTVNTAFTTTPLTDSRLIISPTVTIRGDGVGAQAYSLVNTSTGAVSNLNVISTGSGYRTADIIITANSVHGSGATANAVISPIGGHGKDPIQELGGDKVLLNCQFTGSLGTSATGAGFVPANTQFRRISILQNPILKVNSNNSLLAVESIANTSNSPDSLRLTTKLIVSYSQMSGTEPVNAFQVNDTITNERIRLSAELGTLPFITELSTSRRASQSVDQAVYGANGNVVFLKKDENESDESFHSVYINSVDSHGTFTAFTKDDRLIKRGSGVIVATVSSIKGPEANTFSGKFIYTENVQPVTRDVEQTEDIKVILDF